MVEYEKLDAYLYGGAMVIPVGLLVYYAYASDFQAQGRYIMPMALPFSIL